MDNRYVKNMVFLLSIFILIVPFNFVRAYSNPKVLKPVNAKSKTTILVSGKSRTYYQISYYEPTVVSVKGPGILKIITRSQFNAGGKTTHDYSVYHSVNGERKVKKEFNDVRRDSKAIFKAEKSVFPGSAENITIELGRGNNTIEFWIDAESPVIFARFLFTATKEKKIDWVQFSPLFPNEPVSLVSNEEVVTYYRFSGKKPLRIKIIGPTTLRLLTRVENHYKMKGRIHYRVQVKEDGIIKNTYQLSSVRSEVTVYKKSCGKVPGKAREIIITVPGGKHDYEIVPLDKDKDSILGRALFPKKDVKLKG